MLLADDLERVFFFMIEAIDRVSFYPSSLYLKARLLALWVKAVFTVLMVHRLGEGDAHPNPSDSGGRKSVRGPYGNSVRTN